MSGAEGVDVELSHGPDAPGRARELVAVQLGRWGRADLEDDAVLAVSELVTNAALHGAPPIRLRMRRLGGVVRLEVADGSPIIPQCVHSSPTDTIGRGVEVVQALALRWGCEPVEHGKVVWCDLSGQDVGERSGPGSHPSPAPGSTLGPVSDPAAGPTPGSVTACPTLPPAAVFAAEPAAGGLRQTELASEAARDPEGAGRSWRVVVPAVAAALFREYMIGLDERLRELRLIAIRGAFPALVALSDRARDGVGEDIYGPLRSQARAGADKQRVDVRLELSLAAGERLPELASALDEIDAYCRDEQLLALASSPAQALFGRWLLGEIVAAVRRAAGLGAPEARTFEAALVEAVDAAADYPPQFDVAVDHLRAVSPLTRSPGAVVEARFESLLEAAPDAMVGVDRSGTIRLVNRQTELLFGYPREELVGQELEVLIPDSFRDAHPGHRAGYFADPGTRPMGAGLELSGRRRDGSEFPVDISLSAIDTEDGVLATAAVRDLTWARAARESLRESREIAGILQRSLLDGVPAQIGDVQIAVRYQPATSNALVGGDWYHVFARDDATLGVSVGDVGGHGIKAAATMGKLRIALSAVAWDEPATEVVLRTVNRMLCALWTQAEQGMTPQPDPVLATALYGRLDVAGQEFVYSAAGHPGPIVIDTDTGTAWQADPAPNLPLGVDADAEFREQRLRLPSSGRLMLFTDGLYERRDTNIEHSLQALVLHAAQLAGDCVDDCADALLDAVARTSPIRSDDLALILIGW